MNKETGVCLFLLLFLCIGSECRWFWHPENSTWAWKQDKHLIPGAFEGPYTILAPMHHSHLSLSTAGQCTRNAASTTNTPRCCLSMRLPFQAFCWLFSGVLRFSDSGDTETRFRRAGGAWGGRCDTESISAGDQTVAGRVADAVVNKVWYKQVTIGEGSRPGDLSVRTTWAACAAFRIHAEVKVAKLSKDEAKLAMLSTQRVRSC